MKKKDKKEKKTLGEKAGEVKEKFDSAIGMLPDDIKKELSQALNEGIKGLADKLKSDQAKDEAKSKAKEKQMKNSEAPILNMNRVLEEAFAQIKEKEARKKEKEKELDGLCHDLLGISLDDLTDRMIGDVIKFLHDIHQAALAMCAMPAMIKDLLKAITEFIDVFAGVNEDEYEAELDDEGKDKDGDRLDDKKGGYNGHGGRDA